MSSASWSGPGHKDAAGVDEVAFGRGLFFRRLKRGAAVFVFCLAVVCAMAYVDLVFRARSAYLEGQKYLEWNAHPELKKAYYAARQSEKEKEIEREFKAGRLSDVERREKLDLARFKERERVSESSLKYAYIWFQTAVRLFNPPESRWVRLSRLKMKESLQLWKKELDSRHIPYQDYMFQ